MAKKLFAQKYLEAVMLFGVEKAQCRLNSSETHSVIMENGKVSMFHSSKDLGAQLTVIKNKKRGSFSANAFGDNITSLINSTMVALEASPEDEAYDIAEAQSVENFDNGINVPNFDHMYNRLVELNAKTKADYPNISIMEARIDFIRENSELMNSNRVKFKTGFGKYSISIEFSVKNKIGNSITNSASLVVKNLDKSLLDCGSIRYLFEQAISQINAKPIEGRFVGDLILTPDCLGEFVKFFSVLTLRDNLLISGASIYRDKIGHQICDSGLTLRSVPISEDMADGYFITADGYKAVNSTLIEKGVLRSFLLSQYGAKKTGLRYGFNDGKCYVIDQGDKRLQELTKKIKRGLLVGEFCEDRPNEKGDFSGTVKNSFYIEDGRIKFPVSSAMISGNISKMLMCVNGISKERINFGNAIYPWVSVGGITIHGKIN